MLQPQKKTDLPGLADSFARGMNLVRYNDRVYAPVDITDPTTFSVTVDPARRAWVMLSSTQMCDLANDQLGVLFQSETEKRSFVTMVEQIADRQDYAHNRILIQTEQGLRELQGDGQLHDLTPQFCPHFIRVPLNTDAADKQFVLDQFHKWVDGKDEAESLLRHLATALAPGWPAVRYVLLIGEGANGKSLIMKMLKALFGEHNVSGVTRQNMSNKETACLDLQNKLVNIVFDGEATYLKDSGMEKTLTAGDTGYIRKLYMSDFVPVQTNALFVEGLNREPKSSDKSAALQRRLVRFYLPFEFPQNRAFEKMMLEPPMLGAFLALLIDHYVKEDEAVEKLAPTQTAFELEMEHQRMNSPAYQFLEHREQESLIQDGLLDLTLTEAAQLFKDWRISELNDLNVWSTQEVEAQLRPLFTTERRSKRFSTGKVGKVRVITGYSKQAKRFLGYIRGEGETADELGTMVED